MSVEKRHKLIGLRAQDYEHPLDRAAINALESIPGARALVSKFWEKYLDRFIALEYSGSKIEITKDNYPDLFNLHLESCSILDVKDIPKLYLVCDPTINAHATGVSKPIIGITYGAIERLEEDELLFLLAHELGHIKSGHLLYYGIAQYIQPVIEFGSQVSLGLSGLTTGGFQLALNHWQRMSEFTADRAGLLVCQEIKPCIRTVIKFSGLPLDGTKIEEVEKSFLKQAVDFEDFDYGLMNKYVRFMGTHGNSHPWSVLRASEFLKWDDSEEYKNIIDHKIKRSSATPTKYKFCEKCKHKIHKLDKFCGNCGANTG